MTPDVISCIPSKALRVYLKSHPHTLSILQQATIINAYAPDSAKPEMFLRLIEQSTSENERLLLSAELTDPEAACEIYQHYFQHKGFPLYPFLEVCNLPVLFRHGDIIRWQNTFYYVGSVPYLPEGLCDFSDECYLCYSLSETLTRNCRHYDDLVHVHYHIHVCEADRADYSRLNYDQKRAANLISRILAQKNRPHVSARPAQKLLVHFMNLRIASRTSPAPECSKVFVTGTVFMLRLRPYALHKREIMLVGQAK